VVLAFAAAACAGDSSGSSDSSDAATTLIFPVPIELLRFADRLGRGVTGLDDASAAEGPGEATA
jgi:hypothetical protein